MLFNNSNKFFSSSLYFVSLEILRLDIINISKFSGNFLYLFNIALIRLLIRFLSVLFDIDFFPKLATKNLVLLMLFVK